MNSDNIKSYWIQKNDDGTFSIDIETDFFTVNYSRTRIVFSCEPTMALPIYIEVLNSENKVIKQFSLNFSDNQAKQPTVSEPERVD